MEGSSFSDRINKRLDFLRPNENQTDDWDERFEVIYAERAVAQERMRELQVECVNALTSAGVPTEIVRGKIGTNGTYRWGDRQPATEFVHVVMPEGWQLSPTSDGSPGAVLTTDGRVVYANRTAKDSAQIGDILEEMPEEHMQYAKDENGPYLAWHHADDEPAPTNLEERLIYSVTEIIARHQRSEGK